MGRALSKGYQRHEEKDTLHPYLGSLGFIGSEVEIHREGYVVGVPNGANHLSDIEGRQKGVGIHFTKDQIQLKSNGAPQGGTYNG